jgi:hypothetical protein
MRRLGALLEIYQYFHTLAEHQIHYTLLFLSGEDDYSQDRFLAIQGELCRCQGQHCLGQG